MGPLLYSVFALLTPFSSKDKRDTNVCTCTVRVVVSCTYSLSLLVTVREFCLFAIFRAYQLSMGLCNGTNNSSWPLTHSGTLCSVCLYVLFTFLCRLCTRLDRFTFLRSHYGPPVALSSPSFSHWPPIRRLAFSQVRKSSVVPAPCGLIVTHSHTPLALVAICCYSGNGLRTRVTLHGLLHSSHHHHHIDPICLLGTCVRFGAHFLTDPLVLVTVKCMHLTIDTSIRASIDWPNVPPKV